MMVPGEVVAAEGTIFEHFTALYAVRCSKNVRG